VRAPPNTPSSWFMEIFVSGLSLRTAMMNAGSQPDTSYDPVTTVISVTGWW
jgi:hypothetical protein